MSGSRPPFRQILPKPTAPPVTKEQPAKRRKIANACDCCKKRKVKCDGVRPKCSNCVNTNVECIFSAEIAAAQAAQEKDAETARTARYQGVIDLLRNGNLTDSIQALQNLRDAENLDDAMSAIAEARLLLPAPGPWAVATTADRSEPLGSGTRRRSSPLLRSPYDDSDFVFEKQYMVTPRDQYVDKDMFVDLSSRTLPLSRWTAASSDNRLMNHLLTLFFTWDNIVERCIYRPLLEADVKDLDPNSPESGPGAFCSRFLINALLAVSCIYTMDPATFKDPDDPKSRGRRWADEAVVHLEAITEPSLPLLQGFFAMFVYEGNLGSGKESLQYLMRSFEEYRALNEGDSPPRDGIDEARLEDERQAISWCMWGFYCSEWARIAGFRVPQTSVEAESGQGMA